MAQVTLTHQQGNQVNGAMPTTMNIPPADAAIMGAIAHGHTAKIDQLGLLPDWLESDTTRLVVRTAFQLQRTGQKVHIFNLMAYARDVPRTSWPAIREIFQNGYGEVNPTAAVEAAKATWVMREGDRIRAEMNRLYAETPQTAHAFLPPLIVKLDDLYKSNRVKEMTPEEIYALDVPQVKFHSLVPKVNELLAGGYRNGMTVFYVGPPGKGKSSSLRFHVVDALKQFKRVSYLITENTVNKAYRGLLLALTHLTEDEINNRQGSTPERNDCLLAWRRHCQQYLKLYDVSRFTTDWIEKILAWDQPDLLVIDYTREISGMITGRTAPKDPVGDMAYRYLDLSNHFGAAIFSAGQMSGSNAEKFLQGKFHDTAPTVYNTDKPQQAVDLYIGVKRDDTLLDHAHYFRWKDRYYGRDFLPFSIPFDTDSQCLAFPS